MKCTKYNIQIYIREYKSMGTCTEQLAISSLRETSEKIIHDHTVKTVVHYNGAQTGNRLLIDCNFSSSISYISNI